MSSIITFLFFLIFNGVKPWLSYSYSLVEHTKVDRDVYRMFSFESYYPNVVEGFTFLADYIPEKTPFRQNFYYIPITEGFGIFIKSSYLVLHC